MLLLARNGKDRKFGQHKVVVLFGLGLIGTQVFKHLLHRGYDPVLQLPFTWKDLSLQKQELADITNAVDRLLAEADRPLETSGEPPILDVVWCAGVGGFGMKEAEADREFESFQTVLQLAYDATSDRRQPFVRFHLISSGGGLFEGQLGVTLETPPAPRRCYSRLKLRQECTLLAAKDLCGFIYRPSSVYGLSGAGKRLGLIPTLLINGSRYQVSTIFGTPDTLRDYIPAHDVGRFIARVLSSDQHDPETFHLVSGVSRSLADVKKIVEQAVNRKLFVCYREDILNNTANITFSHHSLPDNWEPSGIETSIRTMLHTLMSTATL
jgi:UDP-glucose 4-epimerase